MSVTLKNKQKYYSKILPAQGVINNHVISESQHSVTSEHVTTVIHHILTTLYTRITARTIYRRYNYQIRIRCFTQRGYVFSFLAVQN